MRLIYPKHLPLTKESHGGIIVHQNFFHIGLKNTDLHCPFLGRYCPLQTCTTKGVLSSILPQDLTF